MFTITNNDAMKVPEKKESLYSQSVIFNISKVECVRRTFWKLFYPCCQNTK